MNSPFARGTLLCPDKNPLAWDLTRGTQQTSRHPLVFPRFHLTAVDTMNKIQQGHPLVQKVPTIYTLPARQNSVQNHKLQDRFAGISSFKQ